MMTWTPEKIENQCVQWYCPPVCQGQIVEVEYGYDPEGSGDAFRRIRDRSEGASARYFYAYAELPEDMDEWPDASCTEIDADWISVGSPDAEEQEQPPRDRDLPHGSE